MRIGTWLLGCLTGASALILSARVASTWEQREVQAEPPLKKIAVFGRRTELRLEEGSRLDEVVDMTLFGTFKPEMTIQQAMAEFGPPSAMHTDSYGTQWYAYTTPKSRVEIGIETAGSSEGRSGVVGWRLYAYPQEGAIRSIFRLVAVPHVPARPGWHEVAIRRGDGEQTVWMTLEDDRVLRMSWYTESGR